MESLCCRVVHGPNAYSGEKVGTDIDWGLTACESIRVLEKEQRPGSLQVSLQSDSVRSGFCAKQINIHK